MRMPKFELDPSALETARQNAAQLAADGVGPSLAERLGRIYETAVPFKLPGKCHRRPHGLQAQALSFSVEPALEDRTVGEVGAIPQMTTVELECLPLVA